MLEQRPGVDDGTGTVPESADGSHLPVQPSRGLDETESAQPASRLQWYRDRLLLPTILAVLVVDQLSKYLVKTNLPLHESWPAGAPIRLTHGTNTGFAFGLLPSQTSVLIVASFFAIGFLFYLYRTRAFPGKLLRFAIGLQLGGAFGNLIDRLWAGAVVDFIDVGWWPVFNLADSSIVVGISLLITVMLFGNYVPLECQGSHDRLAADE